MPGCTQSRHPGIPTFVCSGAFVCTHDHSGMTTKVKHIAVTMYSYLEKPMTWNMFWLMEVANRFLLSPSWDLCPHRLVKKKNDLSVSTSGLS